MTPQTPHSMGSQSAFQVAPFVADVTPRLGDTLVFGLDADSTVAVIEHPLLAKGVVLRDAGGTYVLCALDWCALGNDAYDLFRDRIAQAAGTSPSHVAVHTVQQHTAPGMDLNAQRRRPEGTRIGRRRLPGAPTRTSLRPPPSGSPPRSTAPSGGVSPTSARAGRW